MSVLDYLSGVDHLLTNTLCFIAQTVLKIFDIIVVHAWAFLLYVVLGLPRPPPTPKEIEAERERLRLIEEANKSPPSFDPKLLRRRQYAIDELISTEIRYQKQLATLLDVYRPGLRLPAQESATMFGAVPGLLRLSQSVSKACEDAARRGAKSAEIGPLFLSSLDVISKFKPYINSYVQISKIAGKLATSTKFKKALESLEQQHEPLASLVVVPVQRMARYQLLLKEIAKATPDWHPDYDPLERAIAKLADDAKSADKSLAEVSRRAKLAELEKSIRGCPPLLNDTRNYVGVWEMKEKNWELLLFSDLIVVTVAKTEGWVSRTTVKEAKRSLDLSQALAVEQTKEGIRVKTTGETFAVDVAERQQQLFAEVQQLVKGEPKTPK
jgi:hypothetical protein